MADELKRSSGDTSQDAAPLGFSVCFRVSFLLNPNGVNLENIGGGDNEIGNGTNGLGSGGPVRVQIVSLNRRDFWSEIGGGVGNEPGGAILDSRGGVHQLVRCEAHLLWISGFQFGIGFSECGVGVEWQRKGRVRTSLDTKMK